MWRVTEASLFASTLFLLTKFFQKENFKIEIELFFRVSITRSEKITQFLPIFFVCSKKYGRITKYFGPHIWNILSFTAFFGENSPFLKKLKEFTNFCVFIGSTIADPLFSADMCSCSMCASSSNDLVHPFCKG